MQGVKKWLTLFLILILAFLLRSANLDWDRGTHLQPDERFWSDVAANVENPDTWSWNEVLDPERSPLNPRVYKPNYVYGTLPLWASEAAAGVLMTEPMAPVVSAIDGVGIDVLRDAPPDTPVSERLRFNTGYDVTLIGRLLSALVDTLTVLVVFLLARELSDDDRVGLLGALLQALTVLHIQYSHFLGSEPWVAFFVATAVWGSVRLARHRGGWRTRTVTAVAVGLAIASKLSGVAAVAAPFAACLVVLGPHLGGLAKRRIAPGVIGRIARVVETYLVMGVVAIVAYRVAQPYDFRAGVSLVFNPRFLSDVEYLSDINQGGNWPWVQPLVGATPLWHPLKQMFLWGMGPGLGLAAIAGVARAGAKFVRGERFWAVPLAVIGAYFVLVSFQFYAIVRYLQPAYPVLTALSATALVAAWARATALTIDRPAVARAIKTAVALSIGATVFWALAFVNGVYGQDNARLAAGDWMIENLPADATVSEQAWDDGLPWGQPSTFGRVTLEPFSFGGDTPERIELLIAGLDEVDYVIETSNKFYDALPKTPARFPQMSRYYETLFDGSLGFDLVKSFRNQPSLFGVTIDDSSAEEAFTLYDHPTVYIWRKTDRFSVEHATALLNPDRARVAINAEPKDAFANASMLLPEEYEAQQTGSSYAQVHSFQGSSVAATVLWYLLLQALAIAVAPTVVAHAGRAGGAAYGLSKPLAMVVLALPVWFVVSIGWFSLSRTLIWAAIILVIAGGAAMAYAMRARLSSLWRAHRRLIVATEVVFALAFLAVLWLRATNPDLWHPWRGGEKPMELAYLTAVSGSTTLPPYDPWLAGGSLNYYYLGWFILSMPLRAIGLAPDVGFNLGVVTIAALAAVTVFSTAAMLAELVRRRGHAALRPITTGSFAVLFFLVIGNLDGFRQILGRSFDAEPRGQFDWWDPSRVNKNSSGFEVTEFPNFTVLFADLHPHFMAMPFFGLGLAGALALVERTRRGRGAASWILAVGLGIGSGVLRMVHTWDLPTFAVVTAGAIVFGWMLAPGPGWWRARHAVGQLAAAGCAHLVVTAPYRSRNQVADSGFSPSQSVTNLDDWLVHWGLFLFVGAAYALSRFWTHRRSLSDTNQLVVLGASLVGVGGFLTLHGVVGSVAAWSWLALCAFALVLIAELVARERSTAHVFATACYLLGFAVMVGVESFTQNADIERLNTVFKFWLQIWHLFAIGSAFAVSCLLGSMLRERQHRIEVASIPRRAFVPFVVGLALLLVASLAYPINAIGPRQANRVDTTLGPSLDGYLWLEPGQHRFGVRAPDGVDHEIDPGRDRALIEWLQHNVEGRPTIVEAVGGAEYQWWGRMSITTGLPTVVGWRWHQSQQRTLFDAEVNERKDDVARFFQSDSRAEIDSFLRAYDVTYVVIGSLESTIANPATLALFANDPSLDLVFGSPELGIYQVDKAELARASREF